MSKAKMYWISGFLIVLILLATLLFINGNRVAAGIKNIVLAQINQTIQGNLEVEDVRVSMLGVVSISKLTLSDAQSKVVLSSDEVTAKYDFNDLISGNFNLSVVRSITLNNPKFFLVENKAGRWNLEDALAKKTTSPSGKPEAKTPDTPLAFRGQVQVINGTAEIVTPESSRKLESIAALFSFADYPKISLQDASAQIAGQSLTAKGQFELVEPETRLQLMVASSQFNPAAIKPDLPLKGAGPINLSIEGTAKQPLVKGTAKFAEGMFADLPFSQAASDFHYADKVLTIDNLTGIVYGGPIQGKGTVIPDTLKYNMTFSGNSLDAMQLSDNAVRGRVDFSADTDGTGSFDSAYAAGSFHLGAGTVKGISFGSMTGEFQKRGGRMTFSNVVLEVAGRKIRADAIVDGKYVRITPGALDNPLNELSQSVLGKIPAKLPIKLP